MPFRTLAEIGGFAEDGFLPERFGDLRRTRIKCFRLSSTKYATANHPFDATRVFTGGLEEKTFASKTQSAGDGKSYGIIEFNAPIPIGTDVTASGIGKHDPVTGALIENPADMLTSLMASAGRNDPWFGQLRAEASAGSIVLAGSFTGDVANPPTIRDVIDVVVDSCGAFWCPGMARLYPMPFEGFKIDLDANRAQNLAISASLTDTFDILKVSFDYDEAEGKTQGFLQLEASPQRYGGLESALALPMVRSAAVAEKIGRRVLSRGAGERYDVELDTDASEFTRPGTWALLANHPQWRFDDAYLMFTKALPNRLTKRAHVVSETIVSVPTIALTKHSVGGNSIGQGGVEVDIRNGIATFTILDPQGKALVGAYVALDGAAPKKTDGQGKVGFIIGETGKTHTLDISAEGYAPLELQVLL